MPLNQAECHQLRDLVDEDIDRTLARMKARQSRKPVVVMGVEVPSYRLDELRWQKIAYLLAIKEKLIPA